MHLDNINPDDGRFIVYSDGSFRRGICGWGYAIYRFGACLGEASGTVPTPGRHEVELAELIAASFAIDAVPLECDLELRSDHIELCRAIAQNGPDFYGFREWLHFKARLALRRNPILVSHLPWPFKNEWHRRAHVLSRKGAARAS